MELFKLFGTIAVNNSEANNAIDESSDKAESFGSKLKSGIGAAAKWGTAIVGGATVAAGALVKFAESSASTADNVDKMSQKIGISRQAYQELDFICSQSGTSVDALQMGMKTLTAAMDGAASGTATNVEQFERLGISVTDANGNLRSQEDVMWEAMSALQGMENQTEKARLATELFGRSGSELMPLLNGEAGSIEAMKQQAHDLGLVLGDDLIDSGVSLTDTLDQMKRAFGSIVTRLGAVLMPILEKVAKYIIDAMPKIQALFDRLSPIIQQLFDRLLPPLMNLCETLLPVIFDLLETLIPVVSDIIDAVLPVIIDLLNMLLPPCVQIIQMILPLLISLIEPLLPLLQPIFQLLQPLIDLLMMLLEPLIQLLNLILPPLIEVISFITNTVLSVLQPILEWYANFIGTILGGAIEGITTLIGWCADGFKAAWEGIKVAWSAAGNFFKNIFKGAFDGIKNVFGGIVDWFKTNIVDPIVNFFTGLWDSIKEIWDGIKNVVQVAAMFIAEIIKAWFNLITLPFRLIWENCKEYVFAAFEWIKEKISIAVDFIKNLVIKGFELVKKCIIDPVKEAKEKVVDFFEKLKAAVNTKISTMREKVSSIFNSIKEKIINPVIEAKDKISLTIENMRNAVNTKITDLRNKVSNIFTDIKEKMQEPIIKARDAIEKALGKIRGFFDNLKLKFPNIKLPHFSIQGEFSLDPPSVPHLAIDWYAKAMDNGMIMNKPTIFGVNANGQLMGGGEAGSETVVGTNSLLNMIRISVQEETSGISYYLEKLISMLAEYFPEIVEKLEQNIVLDDGTLVGKLAPAMDAKLGDLNRLKVRGS